MQIETLSFPQDRVPPGDGPSPFDSPQTLVILFGPTGLLDDPAPLAWVAARYPRSQLMGCSTSGAIDGTRISDDRVVLAALRLEHSRLACAGAAITGPGESAEVGRRLAEALPAAGLRAVLVLSDGLRVNGSELVRGLNQVLPEGVVVTGGLAGDAARFERTWVVHGGAARTGHVAAVGLYGERVAVRHGSQGGWDIFGVERRVTAAEGNVLYGLDGRPALELYKEYLGERAAELPAAALLFPLALRPEGGGEQVVRTVLAVDEARQSMTFAGDMPLGARVQLMRANFDRLIDGASAAAVQTRASGPAGGDLLVLAISCVGRRLVLGERTEEEVEAVLEELPAGTRQIGFYSYGEISPHAAGRCELHNQTMTLTTITET